MDQLIESLIQSPFDAARVQSVLNAINEIFDKKTKCSLLMLLCKTMRQCESFDSFVFAEALASEFAYDADARDYLEEFLSEFESETILRQTQKDESKLAAKPIEKHQGLLSLYDKYTQDYGLDISREYLDGLADNATGQILFVYLLFSKGHLSRQEALAEMVHLDKTPSLLKLFMTSKGDQS